jgi:hypothetical protein
MWKWVEEKMEVCLVAEEQDSLVGAPKEVGMSEIILTKSQLNKIEEEE